jgi:hypothetical protein
MTKRTVDDCLREEYFALLHDAERVVEELEVEVRHCLLPISLRLNPYERLVVTSRIKECQSALESLRRRQEGGTFDVEHPELYTLTNLNDLAGVRVLCFPRSRWVEANQTLRERFPSWTSDPVPSQEETNEPLASPELSSVIRTPEMQKFTWDVHVALKAFEEEFERTIREDSLGLRIGEPKPD